MPLTHQDWHERYLIQAQWTRALRLYFFDLIKSFPQKRVLDMGCGTGVLLPDLQNLSPAEIFGADNHLERLDFARDTSPESHLAGADVHHLPYADGSFDLVLCHYFLLWTGSPPSALAEMRRVTTDKGFIVAFAEPDYGGRIDYPPEFSKLRDLQTSGLITTGADPLLGRSLKHLFSQAGLSEIVCGVYDGAWKGEISQAEINSEWLMLEEDLRGELSQTDLVSLRKHDLEARENGTRLEYVPTFYCWGRVE